MKRNKIIDLKILISVFFVASLIGMLHGYAASSDATPPAVTRIEMETQTVKNGDSFTVTIYAEDESGIAEKNIGSVFIEREKESDSEEKKTIIKPLKDAGDGKYVATFNVDDTWISGRYHFYAVLIDDKYGNERHLATYTGKEDQKLIPSSIVTVEVASSDATPPTVTRIEMETQTVKNGDSFTVTIYAEDESGFAEKNIGSVFIEREKESDSEEKKTIIKPLKDAGDGKYVATFNVDDTWISGRYHFYAVLIDDKYGNERHLATYTGKEDQKLIPSSIVTVEVASSDATPPTVTRIEMETQTVKNGDSFTVTIYAEDESGIAEKNIGSVFIEREKESDSEEKKTIIKPLKDAGDGKYVATFNVDDTWISGRYHFYAVLIDDKYGNERHLATYTGKEDQKLIPSNIVTVLEDQAELAGDVNGDSEVDAKDLTALARHLAKIEIITDDLLLKNADTSFDGEVSSVDLTQLAKYLARIISEL